MAKFLCVRNSYLFKITPSPLVSISRTNIIPNALPIADRSSDSELLRNLRIAVTPTYGYGSNTYIKNNKAKSTSSSLAGDPKRLDTFQNIRAEILEKWNGRPQPDVQREWMKKIMFN